MGTETIRLDQKVLIEATVDEVPTNGSVDRYYRLIIAGVVGGTATVGVREEDLTRIVATGTTDEVTSLRAEVERLRYERRILGAARWILELVAEGTPPQWDAIRASAADVAQRIVDEIGHPVTDEPALGPDLRAENARLRAALTAAPDTLARPILAALDCIPDGTIQSGCVIHDGAAVRSRLKDAYRALREACRTTDGAT
jgi:hypothetical protein